VSRSFCQYTFDRARTVYGYESVSVAHAHRALSKSLITLASVNYSRQEHRHDASNTSPIAYLHHAQEAFRIAQDWFGVDDHARLLPFKLSLAHALQARVSTSTDEQKETLFNDAMTLIDDCLSIAQDIYGSMSFKVAQIHRLRSATYLSKKMYIDYFLLLVLLYASIDCLGSTKPNNN
jgi:hypothetical protein